jgi:coproporphyrinogen III oxidase-like Fe-S oxidoreductase
VKESGLLQPVGVPHLKFESISMDFIVGLPKTQNNFDSDGEVNKNCSFYSYSCYCYCLIME